MVYFYRKGNIQYMGAGGGDSAVKTSCCSSRRPVFSVQLLALTLGINTTITPAPGNLTLSLASVDMCLLTQTHI